MAKRNPRKTLKNKLDKKFSEVIREEAIAEFRFCPLPNPNHQGMKLITQCFHFFTRAKESIRWDRRNATGSCAGCNILYEHDQGFIDDVRLWYVKRYGQNQWDEVKALGYKLANNEIDDLERKLKELSN